MEVKDCRKFLDDDIVFADLKKIKNQKPKNKRQIQKKKKKKKVGGGIGE